MAYPEPPKFLPGTRIPVEMHAAQRRRYKELRAKWRVEKFRAEIRRIFAFTTRRAGSVVDDGQEDALWALDHATRLYRVRPARPGDAAWWVEGVEAVAVFNCQTGERVLIAVEHLPFLVSDDDDFGGHVFALKAQADAEAAR